MDATENVRWQGFAEDNATAFVNDGSHSLQAHATNTTAYVDGAGYAGFGSEWWDSPDLASVLQEITDRGGWSANNYAGFWARTTTTGGVGGVKVCYPDDYSGASSTAQAAKIRVVYH